MNDETVLPTDINPVHVGETVDPAAETQTAARRGVSLQRARRGAHRAIADVLEQAAFDLSSYGDDEALKDAIIAQVDVLIAKHRASSV